MSKQNQTVKTLVVAGLLCFVCSVLVSVVVVTLRPQQAENAELDMKKNILMSAGLIEKGDDINQAFKSIETVVVDMQTGKRVENADVEDFNQVEASKNPKKSVKIPASKDVAGLSRRSKLAKVYLKRDETGKINTLILNQWGKGLWSTMYGFIALGPDMNTVKGFGYYSQGETPGLGGEVDNPKWKNLWVGKKIYNEEGEVALEVVKGQGQGQYEIDGLSGATITANGVSDSIEYWFGEHGYAQLLETVKAGEL
ncbi:MAG: Na(+)-translocating NADH-quinone reductase subunit C [Halobacteriovoraceae bacterium]|nr:Na(+)-translocating NADH-quinone reductase subunit C [Halobacteriovoraceae bacterium]